MDLESFRENEFELEFSSFFNITLLKSQMIFDNQKLILLANLNDSLVIFEINIYF